MFGFNGFRKDGPHDEGAESRGKAQFCRDDDHAEAQAEGHDQQGLVVHQVAGLAQQLGNQVEADDEPQDDEEQKLANAHQQFSALEGIADGDGRQDDHEQDGEDIFEDQDAEYQTRKLFLPESQVVECLVDDGRRRHGDHAAEEDGIHPLPPEGGTDGDAEEDHAEDDGQGRDDGRATHLDDFLETEFQAEGEQQEDDADVGPYMDAGGVDDGRGEGEMRTGNETGHDIAQDQRLTQFLENECHDACADQDERKVGYEWSEF